VTETRWLRIPQDTYVDARTTWTIAVNENQHLLGACVILLNRPCEAVAKLTAAEWMDLHTQLQRAQRAVDDLLAPDQYDVGFFANNTRQVSLDVLPRYRGVRSWGGEKFGDPAWGSVARLEQRSMEPAALRDLRDAIRDRLPAVV
jgi:diadenosine tetraphosphate (Ap4A) HIT family hydrolase